MKRHSHAWFVALLALACAPTVSAATSSFDEARSKTVELKNQDHVLFFGDSLTYQAQGATGYVTLVRAELARRHPNFSLKVSAIATNGHTVRHLLSRLDGDVISSKPTLVVIQIGCNDARRISPVAFKAGLEEIVERLQKAKIQVVLSTLTSVGEKYDGTNEWDPELELFAEIARQIAISKEVPLNDLRKAFVEYWKKNNPKNLDEGLLTHDGNHFNEQGNRFVAEQMLLKFK